MPGNILPTTAFTINVQLATFPASSVAVAVTCVNPVELTVFGLYDTVTMLSISLAVATSGTADEVCPSPRNTCCVVCGQIIVGGLESRRKTKET